MNKKDRIATLNRELERLKVKKKDIEEDTKLKMQIHQLRSEILELKKNRRQTDPLKQVLKPLATVGKSIWKGINKLELKQEPMKGSKENKADDYEPYDPIGFGFGGK